MSTPGKKRVGRPPKLTVEQCAAALHETAGTMAVAAELLGVNYKTVKRKVDTSERLQSIVAGYRERRVDKAELKLEEAIQNGEAWAIALTVKTLGKSRGYSTGVTVEGGDKPVVIKVKVADE